MRCGGFLGGLLVGALVGAALGLLFAPEPGEEIRQRIKERAGDYKDRVADAGSDLIERSKTALREGKDKIAGAVRRGGAAEEA